jgi:hypothetical protein
MRFLKKNTDSYVTIGPFIDKTDGLTLKDDLTVTNIKLDFGIETQAGAATHSDEQACSATAANDWGLAGLGHGGLYCLKIPAASINHVGSAFLSAYYATSYLPVFHEFMVVPANVWDSLMGTDLFDVSVTQWAGTALHARVTEGVPVVDVHTIAADAIDATAIKDAAITAAKIASDAIEAAKIKDGAITNAKVADDVDVNVKTITNDAITAASLHTDVGTEIGASVKTAIEVAGGSIASILADTGELQTNQGDWATATGFSTHSAADVKTAVEAAGSHLTLIKAKTDNMTYTSGTDLDVNVQKINDVSITGNGGTGTEFGV